MSDLTHPLCRFKHGKPSEYGVLLAESRSPLWSLESSVESSLQFGKVQNLRIACNRLNTTEIPKHAVFSFWKQIGKANKRIGYAVGRELRQGCLIPTIGGGLCQLSNALYDLALKCGCDIVERHAHTEVVPGSAAERERDATIFWNYVDFRFRPQQSLLIKAVLSKDELIVGFWGKRALGTSPRSISQYRKSSPVNTCTDCEALNCFRHMPMTQGRCPGRAAFLIEECWPEFQAFATRQKSAEDELFVPFHSRVAKIPRYSWEDTGYSRVVSATVKTTVASVTGRFAPGGKPTVALQLPRSEALARYYSERLSIDVSYMHVAQTLLPFLWRTGDLGGRNFSVLMTRLPLKMLHKKLNELATAFPERKTFQEFRAPDWMVEAETEALEQAERIITPHASLAELFPAKTERLEWELPVTDLRQQGECIVFPGPAVARKGAYELRDSLREFDFSLLVLNPDTRESDSFWDGFRLTETSGDWLDRAAVVVQPAFIENNPRVLLRALSAGIPVVTTKECGIKAHPLLTFVSPGNSNALTTALQKILI